VRKKSSGIATGMQQPVDLDWHRSIGDNAGADAVSGKSEKIYPRGEVAEPG
jgi:hypothetical protein